MALASKGLDTTLPPKQSMLAKSYFSMTPYSIGGKAVFKFGFESEMDQDSEDALPRLYDDEGELVEV